MRRRGVNRQCAASRSARSPGPLLTGFVILLLLLSAAEAAGQDGQGNEHSEREDRSSPAGQAPQPGTQEMPSLAELREETGSRLRWEPLRERGVLEKGDSVIAFGEGMPFLLVNYRQLHHIRPPSRGERGELLFSDESARRIREILGVQGPGDGSLFVSTVIIDAGHGGKDPGAVGRFTIDGEQRTIQEKDVVLDIALRLEKRLNRRYPEKNIIMTRDDDTYLTLEERTEIANEVELDVREAMIFISVHANASLTADSEGFEVWYLPPDYRRELIDPEKLDEEVRDVAPILNTMLEEEYTVESVLLARNILSGLEHSLGEGYVNRGLKEESWFVVRNAKMPSVLVEVGFVTNRREALKLRDPVHLKKVTEGIYNGVHDFIEHFERPITTE